MRNNQINTKFNTSFTNRTDATSIYLKEISKYEVMSKEEEIEIFKRIKNGDKKAKDELINRHQRFVFAIAKNYGNGDRLLDLVNEANEIMIKLVDTFDPSMDNCFLSYAVWYIRRSMNAFNMGGDSLIKKSNYKKISYKINKIKSSFFAENGRYPDELEIIDILKEKYGVDIKCNDDLYDLTTNSISTSYNDDDKSAFENSNLFVNKTMTNNGFVKDYEDEFTMKIINNSMSVLNSREKEIIKMYYGIGYDYEMSYDDIALHFNLSAERIRQLKKLALKKMKRVAVSEIKK